MRVTRSLLAMAALLVVGCGSSDEDEAGTTNPKGFTPPQEAPENTVGGFSANIPETTLASGDELSPCWILPLELEGPSRFVAAASLTTNAGMHHGNVTTRKKTAGEGVRPCGPEDNPGVFGGEAGDIFNGGAVLFGSSTQLVGTEWHNFPKGKAYRVKDGYEIVARMHYLNATSDPVLVKPEYRWYTIPEEDVIDEIAPFAWQITDFEIPPLSEHTELSECLMPETMKIVDAMPHMHKLGQRFQVSYYGGPRDGELWLDDQGYDEYTDIQSFDPPVDLSQGYGVNFGCTWQNTFDKPIHEGIGDNEMCILFGYSYPAGTAYTASAAPSGCVVVLPPPPDAP
jgi:hypothetical protein